MLVDFVLTIIIGIVVSWVLIYASVEIEDCAEKIMENGFGKTIVENSSLYIVIIPLSIAMFYGVGLLMKNLFRMIF